MGNSMDEKASPLHNTDFVMFTTISIQRVSLALYVLFDYRIILTSMCSYIVAYRITVPSLYVSDRAVIKNAVSTAEAMTRDSVKVFYFVDYKDLRLLLHPTCDLSVIHVH